MPAKYTTSTGKIRTNLALDPHAYELLGRMAENRYAYGELVSALILAEWERRQVGSLADRVARLEAQVAELRGQLGGATEETG